jgi:adenosylhomocysteinase
MEMRAGGAGLSAAAVLRHTQGARAALGPRSAVVSGQPTDPEEGTLPYDVTDLALADEGRLRVEWADRRMPVLRDIRARFEKDQPLAGLRIAACLHVTTETANLARALQAGGADVTLCASNPLSTQDDTAAALVRHYGIDVYARRGIGTEGYYRHLEAALDSRPNVTMDDGCDLVTLLHTRRREQLGEVRVGTEETTTGVIRLRQMERENALAYPIIAVNDTPTKHMFDNRYGTGQSTIDGILRATNLLLAGTTFVVAGFGYGGKGLAMRARGLGAKVIVTEVDPVRALEAAMEGYRVLPMLDAAREADVIVSVTGDRDILRREHFQVMKDGVVVANSGHFDVEIDKVALRELAGSVLRVRDNVEEFTLDDGRRINLLAEGRLVNLSAAEGHPAAVMDMSFANQALSLEWLSQQERLEVRVHDVPAEIDAEVAMVKLATMGIEIDRLTDTQVSYLHSWTEGT